MYRIDWVEQIKLRTIDRPSASHVAKVHPTVVRLGFTSLFTDISAEMVNSVLPLYLVLHLHMNPLQFGAIDGVYNGAAVIVVALAGGVLADRTRRPKEVALFGYGLSAACKLLLLAVGGAWSWIVAVVAADRLGKGVRTAPRDGLISLHTPGESLATAFAVHRAMDACGSLLGPVMAFALLASMPGAFDGVWIVSFGFAVLGLAVLWLFVQNPPGAVLVHHERVSSSLLRALAADRSYRGVIVAGLALSTVTISDAFLYLLLQERGLLGAGFFPLFYVVTATSYMILSIPMGRLADAWGHGRVLLAGYAVVGAIYVLLLLDAGTPTVSLFCLVLLGLYYAATEGVLAALAAARIPPHLRAGGLALLGTGVAAGKLLSSMLFGSLSYAAGPRVALFSFLAALALMVPIAARLLSAARSQHHA